MPNFEIRFEREVVTLDKISRVIKAESREVAESLAAQLADEFDSSCPEDYENDGYEDCGEWAVDEITETDEEPDDDEA